MPANRRNGRTWPFTPLGTIIFIPALAVILYLFNLSFWWFVKHAGDAAMMLWSLK